MTFKTADLCDDFSSSIQIADPIFRDYGRVSRFYGAIVTVHAFEDNAMIRKRLASPGQQRVLVADGAGSRRCALVGDRLAALAHQNDWAGLIVNGCIRDSEDIAKIAIGLKALGIVPNKSRRRGVEGENLPLHFAGVTFHPGHFLYADADGIVVAERDLLQG